MENSRGPLWGLRRELVLVFTLLRHLLLIGIVLRLLQLSSPDVVFALVFEKYDLGFLSRLRYEWLLLKYWQRSSVYVSVWDV